MILKKTNTLLKQINYNYIIYLLLIISFISCTDKDKHLDNLSDVDFIKFISTNDNATKGIARIDSLFKVDYSFSTHKIGLLYYAKAEYLIKLDKLNIAVINYKKTLNIFTKNNNKKYIAIANNGLGRVNTLLGNYEEALTQVNIALTLFRELKDESNESAALSALAHIQFSFKNYTEARDILKETLKINLKSDIAADSSGLDHIANDYCNLGYVSEILTDKENAISYYQKAIDIYAKIKSNNSIALQNLAAYYLSAGNPKKSVELYLKALKLENNTENLLAQKEIYEVLLDSIKGSEFIYLSELKTKQDSVNKLIIKIEIEEKIKLVEDQYKLIAKEKELKQKQRTQTKNTIIFSILGISLLFLGLLILQRFRNKQLKLIHDNLVLEQKVLRSQMNPHFIFNALTSIQKNLLEENILKSSTSLSQFAKLIRQNFEFTNKNLIYLDEDLDALKNYIETQQLRFEDKFDYQINIQKGLDLSYVKIPPMLLQPFVENAIEHGLKAKKEKGNLVINIIKKDNLFYFEIIDDGLGYKEKEIKNDREHAIDIFINRLKLRNLQEDKTLLIESLENRIGTKVSFTLKL